MLAARRQLGIIQATGRGVSLPAPVKGWNSRDALADMDPSYAVILTNLVPRNTYCELRDGYTVFASGMSGWVETIMAYAGAATNKLFAASGTVIYDISTGGPAVSAVTSLTNARWQYVNNTTAGGNYLQAVNGADKMRVFDGTSWHKDGDGAPYNVTGVDTSTCIGIGLSQNRIWLVENSSLKAWYLPTGAVGGAATALDLSSFCMRGGYIMAIGTWTMDAGYGMDDMTAFITNKGEVLVYRGSDPSSASTWSLTGRYWMGSPVGRRCTVKYAGDLLIICQDGVQPMSLALQSSRINPRISLTNVIQASMSNAITNYGSNYGWQLLPFPKQNVLFLNVPVTTTGTQQQYVMNTITQSWCNFTGWGAACWELYNDNPYFGGNGYVGQAWNGLSDNSSNISFEGLQAFNYFGSRGINKQFTEMRTVLATSGAPSISSKVAIDFDLTVPTSTLTLTQPNYGIWGSSIPQYGYWGQAKWSAGAVVQQIWQGAVGVGKCGAPHIAGSAQGIDFQWMSTDMIVKPGGLI